MRDSWHVLSSLPGHMSTTCWDTTSKETLMLWIASICDFKNENTEFWFENNSYLQMSHHQPSSDSPVCGLIRAFASVKIVLRSAVRSSFLRALRAWYHTRLNMSLGVDKIMTYIAIGIRHGFVPLILFTCFLVFIFVIRIFLQFRHLIIINPFVFEQVGR